MTTYRITATIVTEDTDDVQDLIEEFMNNTRSKVTFVQAGNLLLDIVDITVTSND
jgi:threonine synthase